MVETNNCQLKQAGVLFADGGLERKKAGKSQRKVPAKIPVTGKAKLGVEFQCPIHFRLGQIAMWNLLTRRKVIDLTDPTLGMLKEAAPALFEDLVSSPRPTTMGE